MKLKKIKKAVALSLALAIAATTNTGGLQNAVKIEAATVEVCEKGDIGGITWIIKGEKTNGVFKNTSTTIAEADRLRLGNAKITIPNQVRGYKVTTLDSKAFQGLDIKELTIDNEELVINNSCFEECTKLESIDIKCKSIGGLSSPSMVFKNCSNLKKVKLKTQEIGYLAFCACDNIEEVYLDSPSNELIVGGEAFLSNDKINKLEFSDSLNKTTIYSSAFYGCNSLTNVIIPGTVSLYEDCFGMCRALKDVKFLGEVAYMEKGVFRKSFIIEEENGKQTDKTITFKSSVKISEEAFANCEGLTNVVFSDSENSINHIAGNNAFKDCKSLSNIDYGKGYNDINGENVFSGCSEYNSISASKLSIGSDKALNQSSVRTIEISGGNPSILLGGTYQYSLQKIVLGGKYVYGNIDFNNLPNLETIIFTNPVACPKIVASGKTKGVIYGYSSLVPSATSPNETMAPVKIWAHNNNLAFENIVTDLKAKYNGTVIGTTSLDAIDKSKFVVTANKSYSIDILQSETINPSSDGSDLTGYVLILPDKLIYGENNYKVVYGGATFTGDFQVNKKKATSMDIDWKEEAISQLVSNQPITPADVISGASIEYNDKSIENVTADKLILNKSTTVTGDNTFEVTFVDENGFEVSAEKTFTIKENYITSIKAEYPSDKTLYVGDEIDISKIKLTPVYKYDADNTVNRNITATNCETELKEAGANILKVYYNDIETTMVVSAAAVAPTKLYAMFDTNYTYVEGQKSIDPKSIVTKIEYNNGTSKTIASEEITYEIIQQTSSELQVKVSYAGLESVVTIPVTPKQIVAIKAKANIASATEGTTLPKAIIDQIEMTYNNGNTETLDSTAINYDELTFNDYAIVADTQNVITVNYLGKSTEIIIVGISNTITNIYAEYIGSGQIVGTEVPVSDVAVHAINSNGQVTDVTTGVLLENAIPYNVGLNTVTVHYGSLSCTVTVNGLPAPEVPSGTPSETADVTDKEPVKTEAPTNKPEIPSGTPSAAPTVPAPANSPVVTVSTPDNANSAPVVANTTVTLKASNAKIAAATTDTYKVYTNKNVVIEIAAVAASNIKYQIVAKGAKVSDTAWKDVTDNKITVSKTVKPSIVYIQYKDANGVVQTIHTNGFAVDKKKATVNIKQNKTYKLGKKLTFKDASGINSAKLDGKKIKSGVKVKKKGLHILVVTDKAGNQTVIKFKIK